MNSNEKSRFQEWTNVLFIIYLLWLIWCALILYSLVIGRKISQKRRIDLRLVNWAKSPARACYSESNVNKFTKPYLENIEILLCETAASRWPPQLKLQDVLFRNGNSRKVLISSIKMFISLSLSENPAKTYIPVGWSAVKNTKFIFCKNEKFSVKLTRIQNFVLK